MVQPLTDYFCQNRTENLLPHWPRDHVALLVAYHFAKETILYVRDQEGRILGVFMWYMATEDQTWEDLEDWAEDAENPTCIFLAFLLATDTHALHAMAREFLRIAPDLPFFGCRRGKRVRLSRNLLIRLSHGLQS